MASPTIQSRIKGSIYGVAVVDALGGPVEFHERGTFEEVTEFRFNENFRVPAGTWTDDTSMTLCLAQSLIDAPGAFISQAAIRNYIAWYERGYLSATGECFDIGGGTRQALTIWKHYFSRVEGKIDRKDPQAHEGGQPAVDKVLKREVFCGNGSLMRVAPIGLVFFRDMDMALYYAGLSSDVTHPHPRCAECCKIYTKLIVRSLNGASKTDLAAEFANTTIVDAKLKERLSRYASFEDWNATPESDIKSSGYVLSTLEAALWGFFTTDSFREGALKVVNLGYDADTVGAVYGGLAGAFYGFEEIPERWIRELQKAEIVDEIATGLASLGGNNI